MTDAAPAGVFINCPFDEAYEKCHHAIVLTVVACGLEPRSALETGTASVPRMRRISRALRESKYSIHDLTRVHADPTTALARLNMPFEFGMAFLFTEASEDLGIDHDWLGLLPADHPYGEFISDLAGYDLEIHDGTPSTLIPAVLSWLSTRPDEPALPVALNPAALIDLMPEFLELLEAENLRWLGRPPWPRLVTAARDLVASRLT